MHRSTVNNFYGTIRPVLLVAKLIFFFFETIDGKSRTIRRTLLDQLCFIVTILMDLYIIPLGIWGSSGYLRLTDSLLINVGIYGSIVACYLCSLALPWVIRLKSYQIFELLDNMNQFDIEMLQMGYAVDHQLWRQYSILSMCGGTSIAGVVLAISLVFRSGNSWLDLSAMFPDYWTILAFTRASIGASVFGGAFGLLLMFLKSRFVLLNQVMTKVIKTKRRRVQPEKLDILIRKLADIYDLLHDATELFNHSYCVQAMLLLSSAFVYVIFTVFGLIHAYAANADVATIRVVMANMVYNIFCSGFIIQLVLPASMLNDECKKTSALVHKMVSYLPYHYGLQRELRCFSQQLLHSPPKITCRMFDYDWTLFYALAGSLTTYLVILLQFDVGNINMTKLADKPNIPDDVFV
uniref:gustatory receptor 57 n=1 Tax=Aedes aegypti TaxID=7159 RepID=UPI000C24AD84|nr:gustatory receptor 57 [Aedes aegypti]